MTESNGKIILENCTSQDERERTDKVIRPILRGRDIKNGKITSCAQYLICVHNGFCDKQDNKISRININEYTKYA